MKNALRFTIEILRHLIYIQMYCTTIIPILLVYGLYKGTCRISTINNVLIVDSHVLAITLREDLGSPSYVEGLDFASHFPEGQIWVSVGLLTRAPR